MQQAEQPNESHPKEARLLTAEEVAAYLGVPTSWVYDRSRRNAIPLRRIGKYVRFHFSAIEAWAKAGCPTKWEATEVSGHAR